MVVIQGLSRASVLAALYNASKPQGRGFIYFNKTPMTEVEAQSLLNEGDYFDYLRGRVMKVRLNSDASFEEALYDRDNGEGAAQKVVDSLFAAISP